MVPAVVCTEGEGPALPISVSDDLESEDFTGNEVFKNETTVVNTYRSTDVEGNDVRPMEYLADVESPTGSDIVVTFELTPEDGPKETFTVGVTHIMLQHLILIH